MPIFSGWLIKLKKIILYIIFQMICAIGSTLVLIGLVSSCWFFFASRSDAWFYYGGAGVLLIIIGLLICRIGFPYISNDWGDYL